MDRFTHWACPECGLRPLTDGSVYLHRGWTLPVGTTKGETQRGRRWAARRCVAYRSEQEAQYKVRAPFHAYFRKAPSG